MSCAAVSMTRCTVRVGWLGWPVVGPHTHTCDPTYTIFVHRVRIEGSFEGEETAGGECTAARNPKPSLAEVLPPQGCG